MTNITAKMVGELREATGFGMMECKKALVEAGGVLKKAEEILRIKSGSKAGKIANRTAAEGVIAIYITPDRKRGAAVEVNCETDFVAKDDSFIDFTDKVAKAIVDFNINSLQKLSEVKLEQDRTIEDMRKDIIAKIGENITIRRFENLSTNGHIANYVHGRKIGVIIDMDGGDIELGKDLAMHIVANKPICVSRQNVPQEKIDSERNIYIQQAAQSGKSADIVNKMVEGRINKYLAEVTLLGQPFVKDPDLTVEKLLLDKNAKVNNFTMFTVGEGIEKKVVDFASEVAAAAQI